MHVFLVVKNGDPELPNRFQDSGINGPPNSGPSGDRRRRRSPSPVTGSLLSRTTVRGPLLGVPPSETSTTGPARGRRTGHGRSEVQEGVYSPSHLWGSLEKGRGTGGRGPPRVEEEVSDRRVLDSRLRDQGPGRDVAGSSRRASKLWCRVRKTGSPVIYEVSEVRTSAYPLSVQGTSFSSVPSGVLVRSFISHFLVGPDVSDLCRSDCKWTEDVLSFRV